jgi:WD40 repeat protein
LIASESDDETIKLWAVETGECIRTFTGQSDWVQSVVFSPDGKSIAVASENETIKLWAVETAFQYSKGHCTA